MRVLSLTHSHHGLLVDWHGYIIYLDSLCNLQISHETMQLTFCSQKLILTDSTIQQDDQLTCTAGKLSDSSTDNIKPMYTM